MIVVKKENGLRLQVIEVSELMDGRPAYIVCKETAPNPKMGRFKIAQDLVEPDFK